jgi:REP element-mobilizing transposase RayT
MPVRKFTYDEVVIRRRGGKVHWHVPGGLYFVTYRLADSVPQEIQIRLDDLHRQLTRARELDFTGQSARMIEREIFRISERASDRGYGECFLRQKRIGDLVMGAFDRDDGSKYERIAVVVMPNHVHIVFRLLDTLDAVLRNWKSYTAHEANVMLGRRGSFWEPGYFDVLIRDSNQLERTVAYVLANPGKAGLRDWPWVKIWPERYAAL